MGINGEKILFLDTRRARSSEINETMRDSYLSRCPCVVIQAECAFGAAARSAIFAGVQPSRLILKEFPANRGRCPRLLTVQPSRLDSLVLKHDLFTICSELMSQCGTVTCDLSPIFLKSLHNPNKCLTFAAQEPAKPLNDA